MTTATKERATRKTRSGGTQLAWSVGALKAALAAVRDAVPSNSPQPILRNVLFRDGLLTATDLEIQIETAWSCEGLPPLLLPYQRLWSIVSLCRPDAEVTLSLSGSSCVVRSGSSEWTIPVEDAAEFPAMEAGELKTLPRLPADQFARAVRSVVYAVDAESSRYALGAVLVEVAGDKVTMVATDGRRLSRVELDHDIATDDSATLVSRRALATLARLADSAGDDAGVQLEASTSCLVAEIGGTTVTARLTEGRFPRWRDVFPERDVAATAVDRGELLAATRAAAIVTTEQSKGIDYTISEGGIWLHGQSSESGESSVTCPIVEFGQAVTTKMDPRYVADFLTGLPADAEPNVEIEAVDSESAVLLKCGDCWGVVMPMAKDA